MCIQDFKRALKEEGADPDGSIQLKVSVSWIKAKIRFEGLSSDDDIFIDIAGIASDGATVTGVILEAADC